MFAKVKSRVFIDALKLELVANAQASLKGVLRDDKGSVCSTLEQQLRTDRCELVWEGLSHLPYGVYTLELSQGEDEMKMQLVKRV